MSVSASAQSSFENASSSSLFFLSFFLLMNRVERKTVFRTWIESMSTENTRAPSLARRAASGLPTTSELDHDSRQKIRQKKTPPPSTVNSTVGSSPIDNSDDLPIRTISIRQDLIVHTDILQALDDGQGGAGQDGLDGPWGRLVVVQHRLSGCLCGRCGDEQGFWFDVADAFRGAE